MEIEMETSLKEIVEDCARLDKLEEERKNDEYNNEIHILVDEIHDKLVEKIKNRDINHNSVTINFKKDKLTTDGIESIKRRIFSQFRERHNLYISHVNIEQIKPTPCCISLTDVGCECMMITILFCGLPLLCWLPWNYSQKHKYRLNIKFIKYK